MRRNVLSALVTLVVLLGASFAPTVAQAQAAKPGVEGYQVEWIYRVRYGFIDEWWELFRKYEVPVLERAKTLGLVLDYKIYHPTQHMDEAARWDYRVEITYKDYASSSKTGPLYNELFKDPATRKKDEQRRWELTANHWDLPIYQVDVTKSR
jgi:opacity protein-like surface antigen